MLSTHDFPQALGAARPPRTRTLLLLLLLAAALALLLWNATEPRRALARLPTERRQALYLDTRHALETTCLPSPEPALRDYCRGQAELITRLPECDGACRALAAAQLAQPAR